MITIESGVQGYDTRVLTLTHVPECLQALQTAYEARHAYTAQWPCSCSSCNGTGEREVGTLSWEDPPSLANCPMCVSRGICPRCGASGFSKDGSEPCLICGFDFEGGLPERAFCTCGADSVLYEQDSESLPDFPE